MDRAGKRKEQALFTSTTTNVEKTILSNGLTVLVKESHAAPVVAVLAHVHVGYFNEPDRWNGLSHVVEHMFFKGTRKRPGKEQIAQEVRALGGTINASTYYEETSYYIVLPSRNLEQAVDIQADAFLNSLFDAAELAKEIEVIIQESKQKRDNPGAMLLETMYALAYDRHRIRRWRIGPDEVLRALRREDILAFMEQTYRPENIIVSIVGDVDAGQALRLVERYWGAMPRGELRKEMSPEEPERDGFRYRRMRADIQQRLLEFGFHAPPVLDADAPPLMVLGGLLSDGRSARLFRALKEEQRLVNSVWAGYEGFAQLGVFTMGAETIGDDPLPTAQALFAVISRLLNEPISEEELRRVKTRIQSRRLYAQEEVLGVARNLAAYEALGGYQLADEMLRRLQAVTAEEVRNAAAKWLTPRRATLLEYLPHTADAPEREAREVEAALRALEDDRREAWQHGSVGEKAGSPPHAPTSLLPRAFTLPSGATLLFRPRTDLPIVAFHVLFPGGKRAETPQTAGLTSLMLKSSLKGTEAFTAAEISERIERLGSGIGLSLAPDYFGFSMKVLSEHVREGLAVLKEVILRPTFPAEEVEKEKQTIYGEIRRQRDSMFAHAFDLFSQACYGEQPYGLPPSGIAEAVAALTPDSLRDWRSRWVRGGEAVIAVVGDMEPEALVDLLSDAVPPGRPDAGAERGQTYRPPGERVARIARQQTAAVMGFPGAAMGHDDRHALDLLSEITSGLAGRFFRAVRGDNALAYAVTSFHRARRDAGNFVTYTATSPDRERMAREILLAECARLTREPVGAQELADAKEAVRGEHVIATQTFSAQAAEMAVMHLYGQPLDAPKRYLARIEAVTPDELREVSARYLRPDRMWLGVVRGGEQAVEAEE